jgi:3-phosphoshikimate 1-carboxyvinyltransferase
MAHRGLICAGLANGKSVISNLEYSKDILATINCLEALGVKCIKNKNSVEIYGGIDVKNKIRIGKSTDGLLGAKKLRKPRHYEEIDNIDGKIVVSKIYTQDINNKKHKKKNSKK